MSYETVRSLPKASTAPAVDIRASDRPFDTSPRERVSVEHPSRLRWAVAAVVVLAIAAVAAYLFLRPAGHAGFTLVVNGTREGSEVSANGRLLGTTGPDGRFTYPGLMMTTASVKVSHQGFADFTEEVRGGDGAERRLNVLLLPLETDYSGPMVLVPAGEFTMGTDRHEANERPSRAVSISAFYIDRYEVTNGQYRKFCDATGRGYPENKFDPNYFSGNPNSPVVGVSWADAKSYATWAGKRLPTEEEWEKAASWDSAELKKRNWPWGDVSDPTRANINRRPPSFAAAGEYRGDKSPYGVFDMGGNAGEWVDSYYLPYPGNQTVDPRFGREYRVVRGGSPVSSLDQARTTFRFGLREAMSRDELAKVLVGFRCAVSANDPKLLEQLARGR
jgi:formylglycine-generating enzyme required for sulfatase activity